MKTMVFTVRNIKCDGCVASIKEALAVLDNIESVSVNKEQGLVSISGTELNKKFLSDTLGLLGYPEITSFN